MEILLNPYLQLFVTVPVLVAGWFIAFYHPKQ
jgi:hypothetical protein